ncbi:MAG: putative molybdenum carrier protein [Planctomycetia bacterium]|jgi:hypothetical protein
MIEKIVSGGQTGVDRAALDVAIHLGIPHGGWCPRGRRAEDGPLAPIYQLQETDTPNYAERTEKNVIDSDGTLILHIGPLSGGTLLTLQLARRRAKPCLTVDLAQWRAEPGSSEESGSMSVDGWVREHGIETLNVAGPRESTTPGIGRLAREFLFSLFDDFHPLNAR